ncbi:MAG: CpsB/CapC family capsule biosynthesis tyrosine phosphatase [Desulfobacterales bacterium]|nr:CpsB/CapC family capsule biosynthesis tyrosine phosphatase [Desulfobacterales bacterium]
MIDLHCHILPGIDDGAKTPEESLKMAEIALRDGIHTIVATPHVLGIHSNNVRSVEKSIAGLTDTFSINGINIRLIPGADVPLSAGLMDKIKGGEAGTINNNMKYILLELPSYTVPPGTKDLIFELKMNGITPVITHPERNLMIQQNAGIVYDLVIMGALCQITAMSITGDFGEIPRKSAAILLERRLVHVIASDAHSADYRPPVLSKAVEAAANILGNYEEAERMVKDVPAAIVSGLTFDIPEPA